MIFHTRQWIGVCMFFLRRNHSNNSNFPTEIRFPISLISYNQNITLCSFLFFYFILFFHGLFTIFFIIHLLVLVGICSECTSPKALFISFYEYQKEGENLSITNFFHIHKNVFRKIFSIKNLAQNAFGIYGYVYIDDREFRYIDVYV